MEIINYTIIEIKNICLGLLKTIDGKDFNLPTFGYSINDSIQDGTHLIFIDFSFNFIVIEKGNIWEHKQTLILEELLFWIFESISSKLAFEYASKICQNENQRIIAFSKQIELLELININEEYINQLKIKHLEFIKN